VRPDWLDGVTRLHYGWETCVPGHSFGPTVRNHLLYHFAFRGEGKFQTGGDVFSVHSVDLFLIHPDEITTYTASMEDPWAYAWLGLRVRDLPVHLNVPVIRQAPVRELFWRLQKIEA